MRFLPFRSNELRCFSPEVVLATFVIEFLFAVYAWWRYRLTTFGRLSVTFLLLLAGFQLSEYAICRGASSEIWTRVGFVCTAFLPIIGIDFIVRLRRIEYSMIWGYALATAFAVVMAFFPQIFAVSRCTGTFVAFHANIVGFDLLYITYYLATLFLGVGLAWQGWRGGGGSRKALLWILVGYVTFMLPAFMLYFLVSFGRLAIASVLCGFALIMAAVIITRVLPLAHRVIHLD